MKIKYGVKMTNKELVKELQSCLEEIAGYCREAVEKRPKDMPKGTWDFVLSSIELRALRGVEKSVIKERENDQQD
jgi:hypothetical protein